MPQLYGLLPTKSMRAAMNTSWKKYRLLEKAEKVGNINGNCTDGTFWQNTYDNTMMNIKYGYTETKTFNKKLSCCCDSRTYSVRRTTVGYSCRPLAGIAVVSTSIYLFTVSKFKLTSAFGACPILAVFCVLWLNDTSYDKLVRRSE